MKWYHLFVWGGLLMTSRHYGVIMSKIDELHLEAGEYKVAVSHTAL